MATLETISLEIKANSNGAGQEIGKLVGNIRSLAKAAGTAVASLTTLNKLLKDLKGNSGVKLPSITSPGTSGGNGLPAATTNAKTYSKTLNAIANSSYSASSGVQTVSNAIKNSGEESEKTEKKTKGLLDQIGRIAKMMLIRTAVKSLIKGFQQSWQAAYEFSKHMNGTFAKSIDATKTMLADTTTSIIQTLAPVVEAMVPVLYTITQAIQWLCNQLQNLLKMLGLTSDLFGKSTKSINKYYGSSNKASKAQKNMLASWDELNVIQSKGSDNDSGYNPGALSSLVGNEVNGIMQLIVGEAMLAVGLIMACTGHIPLGVGCMLVGAAAIAKTVTTDWQKLPTNVQNIIKKVTLIVGAASLALGAIFICTGHIGLGIGLLAIGAANLVVNQIANDNGQVVIENIKTMFAKVTAIVGAASLALGAIICLTGNLPLGIGLLTAGAVSLFTSSALSDNGLVGVIQSIWSDIEGTVTGVWESIKGAAVAAWNSVKQWWEDSGLGETVRQAWATVKQTLVNVWNTVKTKAKEAWNAVKQWWEDSGLGEAVRSAWTSVKATLSNVWSVVKSKAGAAWNSVKKWWEESGVGDKVRTAWQSVSTFFSDLWGSTEDGTGIAGWAATAWEDVKTWWDTNVREAIETEGAWGGVKAFFSALWTDISTSATNVWSTVSEWWNTDIATNISTAWDTVSEFFTNLFGGTEVPGSIADIVHTAWQTVCEWWDTNIYTNITTAWDSVLSFFTTLFGSGEGSIENFFLGMWSNISLLWGDIITSVKDAWGTVSTWFYNNVTMPVGNFFIDCINGIIDGVNFFIEFLNKLNITIPAVSLPLIGKLWDETKIGISGIQYVAHLDRLQEIPTNANGAYGIPNGDLFIANEQGAELVGQIGGKTSVANQGQIIEGIRAGVSDANAEQNRLLAQQNELLRGILDKEWNIEPSAAWGKHNQRSAEMWSMVTGR